MRVYFDENFLLHLVSGIRTIQEGRRSDDIVVCSVAEEFGKGANDEEWIPKVAARHGVILTQDTNIHRTRAQWELCRTNKVGVIFFKAPKKRWSYWEIVQLVVRWWPELCKKAKESKKPFGSYIEYDSKKMKEL